MKAHLHAGSRGSRLASRGTRVPALIAVLALALSLGGTRASAAEMAEAKPSPEWTPLYTGRFDAFKIYLRGKGYLADPKAQDVFVAEPDQIHVRKGTSGLLVTRKPYRRYHVRVQYRWGDPGGSLNAGLMPHTDVDSTVVEDNRPRSIEINMKQDVPGSLWMARNLGPFGYSFVETGTKKYLPKEAGGVRFDASPFGDRTVFARYKDDALPTKPHGEWNTMEAIVNGSESLAVLVNGQEVIRLYDIRRPAAGEKKPGEPLTEGGIGLQSEGQEIFYRNFEIKLLPP